MARLAALLASVALAIPSRYAQAQSLLGPIDLWVSAGIEALGIRDNTTLTPGSTYQVALSYRLPETPLRFRASAWLFDRSRTAADASTTHAQAGGIGVDLLYDLGRGRTRPYALAGAGTARLFLDRHGPPLGPGVLPEHATDRNSPSTYGSIGAGLVHRLGQIGVFVEARYTLFTQGRRFSSHLMPLTAGFRF